MTLNPELILYVPCSSMTFDPEFCMLADLTGPGEALGSVDSRLKTSFTLVQALLRDLELKSV